MITCRTCADRFGDLEASKRHYRTTGHKGFTNRLVEGVDADDDGPVVRGVPPGAGDTAAAAGAVYRPGDRYHCLLPYGQAHRGSMPMADERVPWQVFAGGCFDVDSVVVDHRHTGDLLGRVVSAYDTDSGLLLELELGRCAPVDRIIESTRGFRMRDGSPHRLAAEVVASLTREVTDTSEHFVSPSSVTLASRVDVDGVEVVDRAMLCSVSVTPTPALGASAKLLPGPLPVTDEEREQLAAYMAGQVDAWALRRQAAAEIAAERAAAVQEQARWLADVRAHLRDVDPGLVVPVGGSRPSSWTVTV